ncbi:glycosyltransferase [Rhodococcus opacus]|nr:glycosyltransferase [Rhodococcus opacus]
MPTKPFDHLVMTRFNVRVGREPANEDWLRHRLQYFENVCCASIASQTNKDFRWIVLFDSEREPWFEAEVERLSRNGLFEPIWVEGSFEPTVAANLFAERSSADWLITTRVDNDDALARDFIEKVQSQFERQDFEFVNFQSGLQLNDAGELFHRLDPSNAFISLIEKRREGPPRGIYLAWHDRVEQHGPMRQVRSHAMWLQMVHGRNIGNQARGVRAEPDLLAEYFDVEREAAPVTRSKLMVSKAGSAIKLGARVIRKPSRIIWLGKLIRNHVKTAAAARA